MFGNNIINLDSYNWNSIYMYAAFNLSEY